jgi:OmpA-OmpF porin, OOP family
MTGPTFRAPALGLALVSLSGCCWMQVRHAEPETLVVVVPSRHDGHVGAVVLHDGEKTEVLDTAYAAARTRAHGEAVERSTLSAEEVTRVFAPASEALPRRASTYRLYFSLATEDLTPESQKTLDQVLSEVATRTAGEIVVTGHTDRMGTPENNDALSQRRAEAVAELVIRRGADRSMVRAIGMGEREPLVETEDGVAEARNRRVEIIVR